MSIFRPTELHCDVPMTVRKIAHAPLCARLKLSLARDTRVSAPHVLRMCTYICDRHEDHRRDSSIFFFFFFSGDAPVPEDDLREKIPRFADEGERVEKVKSTSCGYIVGVILSLATWYGAMVTTRGIDFSTLTRDWMEYIAPRNVCRAPTGPWGGREWGMTLISGAAISVLGFGSPCIYGKYMPSPRWLNHSYRNIALQLTKPAVFIRDWHGSATLSESGSDDRWSETLQNWL